MLVGCVMKVIGSVDLVMVGFVCGEVLLFVWDFFEMCIDYFMLIDDEDVV